MAHTILSSSLHLLLEMLIHVVPSYVKTARARLQADFSLGLGDPHILVVSSLLDISKISSPPDNYIQLTQRMAITKHRQQQY